MTKIDAVKTIPPVATEAPGLTKQLMIPSMNMIVSAQLNIRRAYPPSRIPVLLEETIHIPHTSQLMNTMAFMTRT